MDGLFVGLEVAQARLFGQIPVYKADYGVNLLRGSPSPPRVSLLHMSNVPSVKVGGVAADYIVGALSSLPEGRAAWKSAVFRGYEALPWRQAWAVCGSRGLLSRRR